MTKQIIITKGTLKISYLLHKHAVSPDLTIS